MKKTCLIIQSGAMGDIFIVAPIAHYYSKKGYIVYWPVREKYFNLVEKYFPYVYPQKIDEDYIRRHYTDKTTGDWLRDDSIYINKITEIVHYDLVLDLADRGSKPNERPGETFEQTKYRVARVPYSYKHKLSWKRYQEKEMELLSQAERPFTLVHLSSSHGDHAELPGDRNYSNIIEIRENMNYEIPDYYFLAIHAAEIFCVESAVHQFFDGFVHELVSRGIKLYILLRKSLKKGQCYTLSEHWDKTYIK